MQLLLSQSKKDTAWNKNMLTGQKPPFKLKEIWAIRIHLQLNNRLRDYALFNLAIDSKLRGCDLVKLKVKDVAHGHNILKRAIIMQQKTKQPVQFEIMPIVPVIEVGGMPFLQWLLISPLLLWLMQLMKPTQNV